MKEYLNKINLLKERLINVKGKAFLTPKTEKDLDDLLDYGQFWDVNNIKIEAHIMKSNECHSNSANYWMKYVMTKINKELLSELEEQGFTISDYLERYFSDEEGVFIVTGYALSGNTNTWMQHSFLIDTTNKNEPKLIETTPVNWVHYYGIVLNNLDCLDFYDENSK